MNFLDPGVTDIYSVGKWEIVVICGFVWVEISAVYRGATHLSLDAKGRMAMPAKYREALQSSCAGELVFTVNRDRKLALYPMPKWQQFEQQLMRLPAFDRRVEGLRRLYIGYAQEVQLDAAGRVLVPSVLRTLVGIERKVVLLGQFEIFELWPESSWVDGLDHLFDLASAAGGDDDVFNGIVL